LTAPAAGPPPRVIVRRVPAGGLDIVLADGELVVAPGGGRALDACAARVHRIDLRADARDDALDDDERRRAGEMLPEVRRRFVAAHVGMREALAPYAGVAPRELEFVRDGGKPRLAHPELRCNLAHSGDLALVAVALNAEVGVDLERIRPGRRVEAIAQRLLSEREHTALAATPPQERDAVFFRLWARNEALVKATGVGLSGLRALHGTSWPPPGWLGCDLPAADGYAAALVVERRAA
jgi:4'-phosphopantetheinyl transferase